MGGCRCRRNCLLHDLGGSAMTDSLILTLVTFVPLLGAVILLVLPRRDLITRWAALAISLVTFVLSLHLPAHYRSGAGFQFETDHIWIQSPNIHYHLGMDGISMW